MHIIFIAKKYSLLGAVMWLGFIVINIINMCIHHTILSIICNTSLSLLQLKFCITCIRDYKECNKLLDIFVKMLILSEVGDKHDRKDK